MALSPCEARFDILGTVWRYDKVGAGFPLSGVSLLVACEKRGCRSSVMCGVIIVMQGYVVAAGVVIGHADRVPEARDKDSEQRWHLQRIVSRLHVSKRD